MKVIGLRRKIAEKMQDAKRRIPHFAYVEEADLTELEELRAHLNATKRNDQPKLTLLPFLMRALVLSLPDFPQINARFDDEQGVVYRHENVDIGIATQTDNGLIVPVVRHAEARDVWDSATEVSRLAAAVRANTAAKEELSGSTITITSLGALGGIVTTPVINHPEVAIIGVNKLVERPVVKNGADRHPQDDEPKLVLRSPRRRRLRRGRVHPAREGHAGASRGAVHRSLDVWGVGARRLRRRISRNACACAQGAASGRALPL